MRVSILSGGGGTLGAKFSVVSLSEVYDFGDELPADYDVWWLNIKMHDLTTDEEAYPQNNVKQEIQLGSHGDGLTPRLQKPIERLSVQILHQ